MRPNLSLIVYLTRLTGRVETWVIDGEFTPGDAPSFDPMSAECMETGLTLEFRGFDRWGDDLDDPWWLFADWFVAPIEMLWTGDTLMLDHVLPLAVKAYTEGLSSKAEPREAWEAVYAASLEMWQ